MDDIIILSNLNDFIFCPASIYFHNLYGSEDKMMYQTKAQLNGSRAHTAVDNKTYSTRKEIITSVEVYSEKYRIIGKIDIYDSKRKKLVERKKHINQVYDGFVFQIYGQYFAMTEMGYIVEHLELHSLDDNKKYKVLLPKEDFEMLQKFENVISELRTFKLDTFYQTNEKKCNRCIYETACDKSLKKE